MPDLVGRLLLGLVLSGAVAGLACWRGSLSGSGVLGAILLGTSIFGFGGWVRGALLVAFFVSSSLLSHYRARSKSGLAEKFAKGSRRDLGQTLANGGLAGLIAVGIWWVGNRSPWYPPLALAFYGALATVTADTWATELGVLALRPPRLITTGRRVPVGTSGGVTWMGTMAALAGALFIGWFGFVLVQAAARLTLGIWLPDEWIPVPAAALSGLAGALFDSFLGATVQAIYTCPACGTETERRRHRCGQPTQRLRGWPWLDNDWVNFLASLAGALIAAMVGLAYFG